MMTTCHLMNRCPSTTINLKTSMKLWSGHAADYNNLKIFGCLVYAHTRQNKLDPRAKRCVFIAYPEGIKGYKLWSLEPGQHNVLLVVMPFFMNQKWQI